MIRSFFNIDAVPTESIKVAGGCVLAAFLGLVITGPAKQAIGMDPTCQPNQKPATLIVDAQSQISPATCMVAMSASE